MTTEKDIGNVASEVETSSVRENSNNTGNETESGSGAGRKRRQEETSHGVYYHMVCNYNIKWVQHMVTETAWH